MPTEIPKNLFDYLVHEQIGAGRFASQQVTSIISLLNHADKEILAKITARGADGTFTAYRLKSLLKEIRQTIDDAYWEMERQLHEEMGGYALSVSETTTAMLAAQVPIKFSFVGLSDTQLTAIIDKTPISIGKDKKLLLEEIFQSIAAGKEESIRGAIRLGMVQGESVPQIVQRLRGTKAARYTDGVLEGGRRAVEGIVRTTVMHTSNQAVQQTYQNNAEVVKGWIYIATLDSRTCSVCFSDSGKSYTLGSGPTPPRHVNCRCFAAPQIKSWKELGIDMEELPPSFRASKDGPVQSDISFQDWLKGQDKATQVELLGKTRAQLFSEGGLKLDKFTDASGKLYTLGTLKESQKAAFNKAFG